MSDSCVSCNRLSFSSQVEVILPVKECHLDVVEIIEYMLNNILLMQLCKSDNSDVILIDLTNMIEFRSVILSVAQLVKLTK